MAMGGDFHMATDRTGREWRTVERCRAAASGDAKVPVAGRTLMLGVTSMG